MAIHRCKRGAQDASTVEKRKKMTKKMKTNIGNETTAMMRGLHFGVLELPIQLQYDILSRLPLKAIFSCRCVCRGFLNLLTDTYFAEVHLAKAPATTASLIVQESCGPSMHMLEFEENLSTSASSMEYRPCHHNGAQTPHSPPTKSHVLLSSLIRGEMTLIGSCNGFLCLYRTSQKPVYYICNPILNEYTVLPHLTPSTSEYTYLNYSGFGFCLKMKQYKVIRFMCVTSLDPIVDSTMRTVAEIHTLGTKSWRSIGDAPCPRGWGPLDPFLNGALHWITRSDSPFDLLCSFDLETEQFQPLPPPTQFDADYMKKISWIAIGSRGGCLCICCVFEDVEFMVWVMKDYGLKESWIKEFYIDIKFYCGVKVNDLHQPIKFSHNGDLWLVTCSNSLVSYSPTKRTFRDISNLGPCKIKVIGHVPSFMSLKDAVTCKSLVVKNFKWSTRLP
ncbi:hypothetical protein RJ639_035219 [Escallonia herrerae]|uniref:F-box domain-containing protein n=1 Tax=Escallonia herrerae TaxID=1293975 RepID=A0AA88WUM5_9ASTE|nr:hypothetical protein RJ639_035219 [Escallonia herrerae]